MCPLWQGEEAWLLSHDGGPRTQLNTSLGDPGHHLHGDTHHPALPASEGNRPDQPLPTTDRCSLGEERGPGEVCWSLEAWREEADRQRKPEPNALHPTSSETPGNGEGGKR